MCIATTHLCANCQQNIGFLMRHPTALMSRRILWMRQSCLSIHLMQWPRTLTPWSRRTACFVPRYNCRLLVPCQLLQHAQACSASPHCLHCGATNRQRHDHRRNLRIGTPRKLRMMENAVGNRVLNHLCYGCCVIQVGWITSAQSMVHGLQEIPSRPNRPIVQNI